MLNLALRGLSAYWLAKNTGAAFVAGKTYQACPPARPPQYDEYLAYSPLLTISLSNERKRWRDVIATGLENQPGLHAMLQFDQTLPKFMVLSDDFWSMGKLVDDEVVLDLDGVANGRYALAISLYNPQSEERPILRTIELDRVE